MRNKYDYILIGLLALMAFGMIGGFWQPIRIAQLGLLPWMTYDIMRTRPRVGKASWGVIGFLGFWWLWAAVSIAWACDMTESFKYVIHLAIYMLSFGEVIWLSGKAGKPWQSLLWGWFIAAAVTVPIALWEYVTDHHLATSVKQCMYIKPTPTEHMPRPFATATMNNLNTYNMLLCCTFVMLTLAIRRSRNWWTVAYTALYALVIMIVVSNGSRGALMAIIIGLIALTLSAEHPKNRVIGGVLLFMVGAWLGLGIAGKHVPSFLDVWSEETKQEWREKMDLSWDEENAQSAIAGRLQNNGLEDPSRMALWTACWEEICDSYLLGVGAANYPCALEKHPESLYKAPHNLWLEVWLQFGIVILAGFVLMWIWPLIRCWKDKQRRNAYLIVLAVMLPMTIVDSTFILKAYFWMLLSSVYVLTSDDRLLD